MKKLFLYIAAFFYAANVMAQTDSISTSVNLDEIEVEAPKVVRKADMELYFPSESVIKQSKDGLQLLQNMMIPTVVVNDILKTVSSSGSDVQLRINGRVASVDQVRGLQPETIKRIEWLDNPGLKYNGATTVLNFVVTNPALGGSFSAQALPALNCAWGNYYADLKLNNGKSQFGLSYWGNLCEKVGYHREYNQTITFPDNSQLHRDEIPVAGDISNSFGNLRLDYSYLKPDTTVLWISIGGEKQFPQKVFNEGRMISNVEAYDNMLVKDIIAKKGITPKATVYFEQHFTKNQFIAIDMNASLFSGSSNRTYSEQIFDTDTRLVDINTDIHDCNQAYGIDANYNKNWNNSRFTAGISYNANRNRSKYDNLDGKIFHQRLDKVYFFGEYFQKINKVSLSAGIGAQYTDFMFKESGQGSNSWNIRPQASISYAINRNHQLRLNFTSWQSAPTLEQTTIAPQQTDAFQWNIGNPELKTSSSYMLNLSYNFTLPRVNGTFGIKALTSPDAIAPCINWVDDMLVSSFENSKGLSNLSFYLSPSIDVIPNWFTIAGNIRFCMQHMRGTNYTINKNTWSGYGVAVVRHWGFSLMASYQRNGVDLSGEILDRYETVSIVALSYDWKNFQFTAGAFCPFGDYDRGNQSLNKYLAYNTNYKLDIAPMPIINIRYNLQWGRQKRGIHKNVTNSAAVEKSSTSAR